MNKIAILTSGGDAPGMNPAIRAVARTAIFYNIEVVGVRYGFKGLIEKDFFDMKRSSVADIIQKGGTVLFLLAVKNLEQEKEEKKPIKI